MFLNSWSIALTLVNLLSLFLLVLASKTAFHVLTRWDPASDSNAQIRLENETWLASTLVQYALGFQVVSLILFTLAADSFSEIVVGAMCATGTLTSNSYGMPALLFKIAAVFIYAFWIVIHHIDISSESYPLLKKKYCFLLLLVPVLVCDIILQTLYINGLKPDIITSCCAVVFSDTTGEGMNLMGAMSRGQLLPLYYGIALVLLCFSWFGRKGHAGGVSMFLSVLWTAFFILALLTITAVLSSYVYAMPYHRCPFCILKPEYHAIGFPIYITLMGAVFYGASPGFLRIFTGKSALGDAVQGYQLRAYTISSFLLILFLLVSSYHYVLYRIFGGEL